MKPSEPLKLIVLVCALILAQQEIAAGQDGIPWSPWYVRAEGLSLMRDAPGSQTFAHALTRTWIEVDDPPVSVSFDSDTILLTTKDLESGFRGGGEIVLGRMLSERFFFEVSYFGLDSWRDAATVSQAPPFENPEGVFSEGNLLSPFTDYRMTPVVGLDYNDYISISSQSRLENGEFNLRQVFILPPCHMRGSTFIGGRYMNIGEGFNYHSAATSPSPAMNDVTIRTNNQMLGVQIGGLFEFQVDPQWWIDCEIKGAFLQNQTYQHTVYTNVSGVAPYDGTHIQGQAATRSTFALDLSLSLLYEMGPNLSVYLGYQALWVDGLALAAANFNPDVNALVSGPAVLVDNSKVVYHGPNVGGTLRW